MIQRLALLLSWIMHPLWMPFYLFITLSLYAPSLIGDNTPVLLLSMMVLIMTGLLPGINLIIFKLLRTIPDLSLHERKDRIMPFAFITMVYAGVAYLFYQEFPIPGAFKLLLVTAFSALAGTLITFFIKVSIHALSASAVTTILFMTEASGYGGNLLMPSLLAVVLSGSVMSARLALDAHSLNEILIGVAAGTGVASAAMITLF